MIQSQTTKDQKVLPYYSLVLENIFGGRGGKQEKRCKKKKALVKRTAGKNLNLFPNWSARR